MCFCEAVLTWHRRQITPIAVGLCWLLLLVLAVSRSSLGLTVTAGVLQFGAVWWIGCSNGRSRLRALFVPVRALFVPVRALFVPVRALFVPVRALFVPVRALFVPVRALFVPVRALLHNQHRGP